MKQRVNFRDREPKPWTPERQPKKTKIHINIWALAISIVILGVAIGLGILAVKGAWVIAEQMVR